MNCPHCGKEMEKGTMYTGKTPYWTQEDGLPIFRPSKDAVMLKPLGDESAGQFAFPFHDFPHVLLCKECKTVLFQYQ